MLDRTKAPEIKEIETVSLPTADVDTLPNGSKLHILKNETQPLIRLDFVFKAGKWYELKAGISDLANKMLFEGTKSRTAKQIADKIAYYGASFENNHGYDRTEFTLYCLSKHLRELLPVVLDVLQNPIFPEKEFELLKQRNQQNLKVQRQKNSYLATHSFTKLIYGSSHPYIYGFEENALDQINIEEVKQFYQNNFSAEELEVFACGEVNGELEAILNYEIGKLSLAGSPGSEETIESDEAKGETSFEEIEESLQSSIRLGRKFPRIGHPDYHKLVILSEILGGYFGSRLMKNIREDKGYTYGIYSTISPKEHGSLFYIGTDVKFSVTEDTLNEIHKEIKLLQHELVPQDELQTVKSYMLGKFLNDITTIFEQCDRYKRIILSELPTDHYARYISTVKEITAEELRSLANTYLELDSLSTAIAGKKKES